MGHLPATTKYFKNPQYEYNPAMVNKDVAAAAGMTFTVFASYDNAQGKGQIEKALGKKVFTLAADADPEIARYQLDKGLP